MAIKYQIYPTLLDSFRYWKDNDADEQSFNDLIDKLNGVKTEHSEENQKGIDFENIINDLIDGKQTEHIYNSEKVFNKLKRCTGKQVKKEGIVSTKFGDVKLYAIFDYEYPEMIADLKTTSNYSLKTKNNEKIKKYDGNFQHKFASLITDKKQFNYVISDFTYFYIENFKLNDKLNKYTIIEIEEFIEFLEMFRYKFKDSKVFVYGDLG